MGLDLKAVRSAYWGSSLASPPDHIPSKEELVGHDERELVRLYRESGLDPRVAGAGEHGSLIGGPDKPLSVFSVRPEYAVQIEPMPMEWFSYPGAMRAVAGPVEDELAFLAMLIGSHLAGVPGRPTPETLSRWLRSATRTDEKEFVYYHIFGNLGSNQYWALLGEAHLSIHEIARAIHISRVRSCRLIYWLHQFARDPRESEPELGSERPTKVGVSERDRHDGSTKS